MKENVCNACGNPRKKKSLVFDEHLNAYCASHWVCNENHPNNPSNDKRIHLMNYEEMLEYRAELTSGSEYDEIKNFMTRPFSIRINDLPTVIFLRDLQESHNLHGYGEAIRYCIKAVMEDNTVLVTPIENIEIPKPAPKKESDTADDEVLEF